MKKIFFITFPILLIDQFLKIYIKTHFRLGDGFCISPFFCIILIENPGMAYGIHIAPGYFGKVLLSFFRFFLISFILFFIYKNVKNKSSNYLVIPMMFIFSGAIGNFLDSALYGFLFNTGTTYSKECKNWIPYSGISKINFDSINNGYASFMEGCVVDIFHLPIIDIFFPNYIPFFGGKNFQFFKPVFNVSDMVIFIGVVLLLFFRKRIQNIKFL
ncbi:lipoprotein signal peptidase [Blattabacterium cuenoti]|uniref:lipoprotein signal peptidase n=1 Tax=Blattabacterium cuenoti TaxID=1653831 RepID=UPI00163BE59A|nr:lipoprotein signal peptidase [Blattabacterium cuenoti]